MYCRMMLMVGEQVVTAAMMIESPKWLSDKGRSAVIYDVREPEPAHEDTEAGDSLLFPLGVLFLTSDHRSTRPSAL